ncbi:MAG: hypothetical protein ACLS74_00895 [Oscillibacter sp.]|jgi:hypothetical protein|nr:MAG TPA: hypothetical protein [Caudoviricetes sp.]
MKRLTSEEVRVDESVDRYLGPLADLEGMKPKLLDLILNGPVLNGVSKDVLRQIIRQLYSALAAYEDTRLTPERCAEFARADAEGRYIVMRDAEQEGVARLRELAEADRDGRLVVLPCKVGDTVYLIVTKRARNYTPEFRFVKKSRLTFLNMERILQDFGKEAFLTREEAEKALEAME